MKPSSDSEWLPEVYVFVPYTTRGSRMESPEYDTPSYRAEVKSWFDALNLAWRWVPITLKNLNRTIEKIQDRQQARDCVVFNLCDGDEIHGYPGPSVVRCLEQSGLPFTGASSAFFDATTFKVPMKERFLKHGVPTPPFARIRKIPQDIDRLAAEIGYPLMIKPEVSAASVGISLRSLVHDAPSAIAQLSRLIQGEWGQKTLAAGIFAEHFVDGPEFTMLIVADRNHPQGVRAYPAVERIFHSALPPHERFLSYGRYWSEYKEEARLPAGEPFYRYSLAAPCLQEKLVDVSTRAFFAVSGTGYARVDVRMEARTGELFVLEVNSNCGLSGDRETSDEETAVGEILHLAHSTIHQLIAAILEDAFDRFQSNGLPVER